MRRDGLERERGAESMASSTAARRQPDGNLINGNIEGSSGFPTSGTNTSQTLDGWAAGATRIRRQLTRAHFRLVSPSPKNTMSHSALINCASPTKCISLLHPQPLPHHPP